MPESSQYKRTPKKKYKLIKTNDDVFMHEVHQAKLDGLAWVAIAQKFSMPTMTIYDAWKRYVERHRTDLGEKIDEWKKIELDRLERVISLAFEDYIKSRSPTITKTATKKPGKDGGPDQVESSVKEESNTIGDPRYLNIINQSIAQQCKILGIGQGGVAIAVGVTGGDDREEGVTENKPVFVVMSSHQDVAEFEQLKQLMRSGGYEASKVIDGKLIERTTGDEQASDEEATS